MARYDFKSPRLYVEAALTDGGAVALEKPQAHYLTNVLRLKAGDTVLAFNGKDGEWRKTNWWLHPETRTLTFRELEKLSYVTITGRYN